MAVDRNFEKRKRNKGNKDRNPFVIIGCEGNKKNNQTEKNYIMNYNSRRCIIRFSNGNSTDPVGIVRDLLNYARNETGIEEGDKLYAIFDTDTNPEKQEQIDKAKKLANKNGVEIITSTPAFEVWFLLHFLYTTKTYTSSESLLKDLKRHIDGYSKNENIFPKIRKNTEKAIDAAKKLEQYHIDNGQALDNVDCNPYTAAYKVIEELLRRNAKEDGKA